MSKNYNDEELYALGRRAVACKGWRWLGGMKALNSFRVVESVVPMMFPVDTPDLSDPATLGALSALVTEAYYDPKRLWNGYVEVHRDQHAVFYLEQAVHDEEGALVWNCVCSGETEAEVIVRALEIAT